MTSTRPSRRSCSKDGENTPITKEPSPGAYTHDITDAAKM